MKNLLFAAATICSIVLFSCGDSCDVEEMAAQAQAYSVLGQAYADSATLENCNAYSAALQEFIDDFGDCEDTEIVSQVTTTQTFLDSLVCQ